MLTSRRRAPIPGLVHRWPARGRWLPGLILLAVLAAACGRDPAPAPATTTGTALPTRTTLPPVVTTAPTVSTTTTIPAEVATDVNACDLLESQELGGVAGESPGPGTPEPVQDLPGVARDEAGEEGGDSQQQGDGEADAGPPNLLLAGCTWPTDGAPAVTLSYLAPTTSASALEHLQRLIDLDTEFARGARVFPLPPVEGLGAAALVDESGSVIEIAVVTGSALLYVVPREPPASGTREASSLQAMLLAAAQRAPG